MAYMVFRLINACYLMILLCSLGLHHINITTERSGLCIGVLVGQRVHICVVILALEHTAASLKLIVRLREIVVPLVIPMVIGG